MGLFHKERTPQPPPQVDPNMVHLLIYRADKSSTKTRVSIDGREVCTLAGKEKGFTDITTGGHRITVGKFETTSNIGPMDAVRIELSGIITKVDIQVVPAAYAASTYYKRWKNGGEESPPKHFSFGRCGVRRGPTRPS